MQNKAQITETTRRAILDAFWEIFQETSVDRITVSRLSQAAHVHRSTFYRYFSDVYDVMEQLQKEELAKTAADAQILLKKLKEETFRLDSCVLLSIMGSHAEKSYFFLKDDPGQKYRMAMMDIMRPLVSSIIVDTCTDEERMYLEMLIPTIILTNIQYKEECDSEECIHTMITVAQNLLREGIMQYLKID